MCAIQARKHIVTLRRATPDITIEIRRRPAHKGIPGSEKAGEWAKLAAEEPDSRGVEWRFSDRHSARQMPLPVSRTQAGEVPEEKWAEAKRWPGGRVTGKKYKLPTKQRPDGRWPVVPTG